MRKMPIYLALETRLQMEVWFVLLRCYATPELYGPPSPDPLDAFRCHRSLSLRIVEGRRLHRPVAAGDSMREKEMDTYCEIMIESEIRGKTSTKKSTLKPLWTEDFEFMYFISGCYWYSDLPEHIDDVEIHLRYIRRNRDLLLGKVTLNLMETEFGASNQSWYPIIFTARDGLSVERVGDLDLKYKLEELVILMSNDYSEIRKVFPHTIVLI
jgi:C2 domain